MRAVTDRGRDGEVGGVVKNARCPFHCHRISTFSYVVLTRCTSIVSIANVVHVKAACIEEYSGYSFCRFPVNTISSHQGLMRNTVEVIAQQIRWTYIGRRVVLRTHCYGELTLR